MARKGLRLSVTDIIEDAADGKSATPMVASR